MSRQALDYTKSAERWQRYGEEYHKEARDFYSEINKTALTIASVLFGFMGIFIQVTEVNTIPIEAKIILSLTFLLLTVSITSGVFLFIKVHKFLNKAGDHYAKLSENLFKWIIQNNDKAGLEYPTEIYNNLKADYFLKTSLSHSQLINLAASFGTSFMFFLIYLFS